ncbi:MAG: orotate phosphoribosyltransferase [Prevotella sp.]|nr:orotate phosphoribosyltransferase [Prevotella sp.]
MEQIAKKFSSMLLEIGAIKLSADAPFTWASGWQSPIYTDNRKTLAFPEVRSFVKGALVALIRGHFPAATAVAGVATGAIAQGALTADVLGLPYCYVRSKAKEHGMGNLIEGTLPEGSKVVVVEDLISTGGSSLKAVAALRAAGFDVIGMAASYTYGFPQAEKAFCEANVKLFTISNYATTMLVAKEKGLVSEADAELLSVWRKMPERWTGKNNVDINK